MILTDISSPELESYEKIHPGIKPAIDMMKKITAENLPVGKYEVDGDRMRQRARITRNSRHTGIISTFR